MRSTELSSAQKWTINMLILACNNYQMDIKRNRNCDSVKESDQSYRESEDPCSNIYQNYHEEQKVDTEFQNKIENSQIKKDKKKVVYTHYSIQNRIELLFYRIVLQIPIPKIIEELKKRKVVAFTKSGASKIVRQFLDREKYIFIIKRQEKLKRAAVKEALQAIWKWAQPKIISEGSQYYLNKTRSKKKFCQIEHKQFFRQNDKPFSLNDLFINMQKMNELNKKLQFTQKHESACINETKSKTDLLKDNKRHNVSRYFQNQQVKKEQNLYGLQNHENQIDRFINNLQQKNHLFSPLNQRPFQKQNRVTENYSFCYNQINNQLQGENSFSNFFSPMHYQFYSGFAIPKGFDVQWCYFIPMQNMNSPCFQMPLYYNGSVPNYFTQCLNPFNEAKQSK